MAQQIITFLFVHDDGLRKHNQNYLIPADISYVPPFKLVRSTIWHNFDRQKWSNIIFMALPFSDGIIKFYACVYVCTSVHFPERFPLLVYVGLIWYLDWSIIRMSCTIFPLSCRSYFYFLFAPTRASMFHENIFSSHV